MVNLRDLLFQPALPGDTATFHTLPGAAPPSLSHKNWVQGYPEVRGLRLLINPGLNEINTEFGHEDDLDSLLLAKDVNPLNDTTEWLQKEGDSVRTFYTHVSIQLAFKGFDGTPFIVQRSESGPLGSTQVPQTVDFTWGYGDQHCLMIGELKRHGIINRRRWAGQIAADNNRRWLGQELRAYCHKYKYFAASVFDGQHLLILVFQAEDVRRIRGEDYLVIGLLFSRDCATLRYGLFRTVTYQVRRMQAAAAPAVNLDGYARRFVWGSWNPCWVNKDGEHAAHPNGYIRRFNPYGAWFWAHPDGNPVMDQNGQTVWDTTGLF